MVNYLNKIGVFSCMLSFEDLKFSKMEKGGQAVVRVSTYGHLIKDFLEQEIFDCVGEIEIEEGVLTLKGLNAERTRKRFMRWFRGYKKEFTSLLNGNKVIFVDEDLGLPLIGLNFIGILDKGSEILEVKPLTGCNADCIFCSVDEGKSSKKNVDFVVDREYLVGAMQEILDEKGANDISLWINPHGEPTLYSELTYYCDEMLADSHVKDIHIVTNGILLNKELVDKLKKISDEHGKGICLSVSVSGISTEEQEKGKLNKKGMCISKLMMGENYNIDIVLKNIEYAASKLKTDLTPVLVAGMNEEEMKEIIKKAKMVGAGVSIQKFCRNKRGRNPVKEEDWDTFFEKLKKLEKETGFALTKELGKVKETKELPHVCDRGDKINIRVICEGRYAKDKIGVVETDIGRRAVSITGCNHDKKNIKAEVIQCKHNMILVRC